uniref:Uncharacterized protein n=1 Tax=Panagrellus redivivus TaxID=6233 RepID=A0A7E4VEQ4_PANRE
MRWRLALLLCFIQLILIAGVAGADSDEDSEENEEEDSPAQIEYYKYLMRRLKQSAKKDALARQPAEPYSIPGPFEPLPGRSHNGDYWPVFPFQNQYSGGVDLDPSISRHIGGDINIPVPSWGMMDIQGRFWNRISDTTTKFGYMNHPVNMLGLNKEDFTQLVSDPALAANRNLQPLMPLGKVPKSNVPISCKAPMCNPYQGTFGFGMEHDFGGHDGNEGDINIPFPVSKGVAYRFPFGGNYYYHRDNVSVSYGHNLSPLDPYNNPYMFNNEYTRRRELLPKDRNIFPRERRSVIGYVPVVLEEVYEPPAVFERPSASKQVKPTDFKTYKPLQRLRRLVKRGADGDGSDLNRNGKDRELQNGQSDGLYRQFATNEDGRSDGNRRYMAPKYATPRETYENMGLPEKRVRIALENMIIPVDYNINNIYPYMGPPFSPYDVYQTGASPIYAHRQLRPPLAPFRQAYRSYPMSDVEYWQRGWSM